MSTKKGPKGPLSFNCEICNFICSKRSKYDIHILTAKHKESTEKGPKGPLSFNCEKCNFICSKKSKYDRHILTAKHKASTTVDKKVPHSVICECGKKYKERTGLWKHKKKCNYIYNASIYDEPQHSNIMNNLIKQNEQLHKMIIIRDEEHKEEK
jgi:hypothetical protein